MATATDCDMYRHFRERPLRQDEFSMHVFHIDDSGLYASSHNDDNTLDTYDEETCLGL